MVITHIPPLPSDYDCKLSSLVLLVVSSLDKYASQRHLQPECAYIRFSAYTELFAERRVLLYITLNTNHNLQYDRME